MIPIRILLENAFSFGDLNTVLNGIGLKGMSLRGLEKRVEEKNGKVTGNNLGVSLAKTKETQIKLDRCYVQTKVSQKACRVP